MKKIISHAISGLIICLLLGLSLGNVQGGNSALIPESDPLTGTTYDQPLVSATAISAGGDHTCAVTTEGGVKCWGENWSGQLGDDSYFDSPTPVDVVGLTNEVVIAVSAGVAHTCALTSTGGVKCWGYNELGQLGDETTNNSPTPVDVKDLSNVLAISAGAYHTCALTSAGGVKCWGNNYKGQLGYETITTCYDTPCSSTPMSVKESTNEDLLAKAVSAGEYHTCALTTTDGVKCWGGNDYGQLGDGTTDSSNTPVVVSLLTSGVKEISAGESHTCAVTSTDGVICWGNNGDGQLGDGTTIDRSNPVIVKESTGEDLLAIAVSAGNYHTCARISEGGVKCWGDNGYGQLGDGTTIESLTPVFGSGLTSGVREISAGKYHTCALTSGGGVKCWGGNEHGQLGDGTTTIVTTAVDVVGLTSGVKAVSAGFQYTCALTETGGVKCWGDEFHDLTGDWTNTGSSTPVDVDGLTSGVKAVSSGKYHTCAITEANGVKCWGYNGFGQLGDGTRVKSLTPVDVVGFFDEGEDAIAISAGDDHTCALTSGGGVKCWGYDGFGQLGDGNGPGATTFYSSTPVNVVGLANGVKEINAGGSHTCALTENGGIKCWGDNQFGHLGYNVTTSCSIYYLCSDTPDFVVGFSDEGEDAVKISAGFQHTCAITSEGGVKCWGKNENGQLGDGTRISRSAPVIVKESSGEDLLAVDVSAGLQHTCALTENGGGVKCWGDNDDGQLGDGTTTERIKAVSVFGLTSGMIEVSAGEYHTCAITVTGGVKCWGDNNHGQLGWKLLWIPVDVIGFVDIIDFLIYLPVIVR